MIYYLNLQYRILNRHLIDFGVLPGLAYILSVLFFVGISKALFSAIEFSGYIFIFIALSFITRLSHRERNEFLKSCFPHKMYFKIRLIENTIVATPFFMFLLYQNKAVFALVLIFLSSLLSVLNIKTKFNHTLPTPFSRYPFEFTVGFRKTFYIFIFAYFLTYKSIEVGNLNLGLFSLLLVFFNSLSYYFKLENKFYVWIYALNPKQFLFSKIKTALLYSTAVSIPVNIAMYVFFSDKALVIFVLQLLSYSYMLIVILAKYSRFPEEISLFTTLVVLFAIVFQPLLIVAVPFFYYKSVKKLKLFLK